MGGGRKLSDKMPRSHWILEGGWGGLQAVELGPWIGYMLSRSSDIALVLLARILYRACTENKISGKPVWERKVHKLSTELDGPLQS